MYSNINTVWYSKRGDIIYRLKRWHVWGRWYLSYVKKANHNVQNSMYQLRVMGLLKQAPLFPKKSMISYSHNCDRLFDIPKKAIIWNSCSMRGSTVFDQWQEDGKFIKNNYSAWGTHLTPMKHCYFNHTPTQVVTHIKKRQEHM